MGGHTKARIIQDSFSNAEHLRKMRPVLVYQFPLREGKSYQSSYIQDSFSKNNIPL